MKATKYMRKNTQCPISQWADSEIAKHSNPSNLGEEYNAEIAVPLLKRFKSKLAKPKVDPLEFTKDPKFKSINLSKTTVNDCICSVLWGDQWLNVTGENFDDCLAKMARNIRNRK